MHWSRAVLACLLCGGLVVASCGSASAQTRDNSTFDDASGLMWGFGTLEAGITGALLATESGDACRSWGCVLMVLGVGVLSIPVGIGVGIGTGLGDVPSDVPFTFHQALWGGVSLGVLAEPLLGHGGAVAGAVAGALGMGTYAALRRDRLLRDPELEAPTHVMTWLPPLAVGLATGILTDQDVDGDTTAFLIGLVGALALGASILWAEVCIASTETGAAHETLGFGAAY